MHPKKNPSSLFAPDLLKTATTHFKRSILCARLLSQLSAFVVVCHAAAGSAATLTYDADSNFSNGITDGNTANWNTTVASWNNGTANVLWPNTNADVAVFGGGTSGTAGTVTVGTVTANGITFNAPFAGSYTLNGGTITLAGTTPTITVGPAVTGTLTGTINSVLAGTNGLTKSGVGTLTLTGSSANTFTGTTNVLAGTLILSKSAGVNAVGGDIIINGGNLQMGQSNVVPDSASITLISGGLQLNGLTETIANLTLQGGNSNLNTSSNGGFLTVTGTLAVNGTGNLGLNSGGQWTINKADFTGASTSGTVFSMTGNGTRITQFIIGAGGLTISGQTFGINRGTATTALGSEIVLNGNVTASGNNTFNSGTGVGTAQIRMTETRTWNITAGATTINSMVVGAGGLTKTGTGSLAFRGTESNTYTGLTTVTEGTLLLGKTVASGVTVDTNAIAGDINVGTNGILDWDLSNQLADTVNITLSGGALKFDNANETFASLTQTAGTVNSGGGSNAGIVTITGLLRMSGGSSINLNSNGIWSVGSADFTGVNGGIIALNGNGTGSSARVNQFIVGAGGIVVGAPTGTQTISINKGTSAGALGSELTLNGTFTSSGTVNISTGGTIGLAQVNLGTSDRIFNVTGGTLTSNVAFVGAGANLVKQGAGVLTMNAVSTYTGNTVISAGTFRMGTAGDISASPRVVVAPGATFDVSPVASQPAVGYYSVTNNQRIEGGGTILGTTWVTSGSTVAAGTTGGDTTQKLTFTAELTLRPGSRAEITLGGSTFTSLDGFGGNEVGSGEYEDYVISHATGLGDHGQISVGSYFYQEAGSQIQVLQGGATLSYGQIFNLIDWSFGAAFLADLGDNFRNGADDQNTGLDLPSLVGTNYVWDISFLQDYGVIVVVPEPSRVMLVLMAGAALILRRRRSSWA